jgi:hypothetical protein
VVGALVVGGFVVGLVAEGLAVGEPVVEGLGVGEPVVEGLAVDMCPRPVPKTIVVYVTDGPSGTATAITSGNG